MGARFFRKSDFFTGPQLTPEMVVAAEATLGYVLPAAYLALLTERNGGSPIRQCFPTTFATCWAPHHFEVDAIVGIGGTWGVDSESLGSRRMISEWGYPDIGVVIGHTPSGGHDTVMLDYNPRRHRTACGVHR